MINAFEKIMDRLEELRETYDEMAFIEMNTNGHTLDFEYAKGKKDVMLDVKKIVQEVAAEYKNGHFGCNFNGEHEKCKDCCITNCKKRNAIWFGLDGPDTDVGAKWIPCKKAFPSQSAKAYGDKQKRANVLVTLRNGVVKEMTYEFESQEFWEAGDDNPIAHWKEDSNDSGCDVVAWMKLPEPYKEKYDE